MDPRLDCVSSIAEQGFAIIPDVFGDCEITGVVEKFYRRNPARTRAGVRHALKYPEIAELAQEPRLIQLASQMLGGSAFPYRATLFDKSPAANWLVVWHQDTALPIRVKKDVVGWGPWSTKDDVLYAHAPATALSKIVALRVHFDDSTVHNGPLRVLPKTHELGVLTDDEMEHLEHRTCPVTCTVGRGGVVGMRPLIVHSSSKSQKPEARRVLHIEYAAVRTLGDSLELAIT